VEDEGVTGAGPVAGGVEGIAYCVADAVEEVAKAKPEINEAIGHAVGQVGHRGTKGITEAFGGTEQICRSISYISITVDECCISKANSRCSSQTGYY
ncbi:MAG TPA: hypothetical protein VN283_06850, partial [Thiobacillus sp.]|nr:hypothetical protein [Thiobacillus sp.]